MGIMRSFWCKHSDEGLTHSIQNGLSLFYFVLFAGHPLGVE